MRTDPAAVADWPSPTPEDEVRSRIASRTRVLRRRRKAPLAGIPIAALAVAAALVLPDSGMRLSTEQGPADNAGGTAEPTTDTTASTTTTTDPNRIVVSEDPRVEAYKPNPTERVYVRGVGTVHETPRTPTYSTGHPLLTDPQGDATAPGPTNDPQPAPALDATLLDVTATASTVTTRIVVPRYNEPISPALTGEASHVEYVVILRHRDGAYALYARWEAETNRLDGYGIYVSAEAQAGNAAGAYSSEPIPNVRLHLDPATGAFTLSADFADLNAAAARKGHGPIGLGTEVRPEGRTQVTYGPTQGHEPDHVASADPGFTYRLGD